MASVDDILSDVLDDNEILTTDEKRVIIKSMTDQPVDFSKSKTVELDLFAIDLELSAELVARLRALHCFPRSLELNQCLNFSLAHLRPFFSARHWPLSNLNISESLFDLDSFTLLTSSLHHFPLLESLTLSNCQLTSEMALILIDTLFSSPTAVASSSPTSSTSSSSSSLSSSSSPSSSLSSSSSPSSSSSSSWSLLDLDIQHNPDMGSHALSLLLLKSLCSLRKLVLSGCNVTPDALLPMIQALHASPPPPASLKELHLDQNAELPLRLLTQLVVPQLPLESLQIAWCSLEAEDEEEDVEEEEQGGRDQEDQNNLIYRELANRLLAHPFLEKIDFGAPLDHVDSSIVTAMVDAFERNRCNNRARSPLSLQVARLLYKNDLDPSLLPDDTRIFYERIAVPLLQYQEADFFQSQSSDSDSDD